MRSIDNKAADTWLEDPENLANRFDGNVVLTREDSLRIYKEKFKKSPEGEGGSTPSEESALPELVEDPNSSPSGTEASARLSDAERAEAAVLALTIGPAEASRIMGISESHASRLASGERGNATVKELVEETLEKARGIASKKLLGAIEGINTDKLDPVKATQVAVGLATVVEKIENRGKKDSKGIAVVYRTSPRPISSYEEVVVQVG